MKRLLFTIPMLLLFITGYTQSSETKQEPQGNIEISFTNTLSFDDLVKIKSELAEKGITLNYQSLEFDENGKLKVIAFQVDFHDGHDGSASCYPLLNHSSAGFYRNYDNSAISSFGTWADCE